MIFAKWRTPLVAGDSEEERLGGRAGSGRAFLQGVHTSPFFFDFVGISEGRGGLRAASPRRLLGALRKAICRHSGIFW